MRFSRPLTLYLRCLTVGNCKLLMYEGPAYNARKTTTTTTNKITKQKKETRALRQASLECLKYHIVKTSKA